MSPLIGPPYAETHDLEKREHDRHKVPQREQEARGDQHVVRARHPNGPRWSEGSRCAVVKSLQATDVSKRIEKKRLCCFSHHL